MKIVTQNYYRIRKNLETLYSLFINPTVTGTHNIPDDKAIIIAGNHISPADPFHPIYATTRQITCLVKEPFFSYPILGKMLKDADYIPVAKDKTLKPRYAYHEALGLLKKGQAIAIFPEGGINRGPETLLPFKTGTARLALEADCDIVPMAIKGSFIPFFHKTKVAFGKPISIKGLDPQQATILLSETITTLLKELD